MRTIFWPIRNSIQICGWRLDSQVDPIKIGFMGSPTPRPTTCGRPVVFQPLGAPNLRSSWPCSNTRLNSPTKYDHLSAEYAQLKASHVWQRAESKQIKTSQAQQKAEYEQLREMVMNMATHSGTCAPNPFWPYNHQPPPSGYPPPPPAPPFINL